YPAAFCAALLGAQPMGFYSPQSLVADARRHGVEVRRPDVAVSAVQATLEPCGSSTGGVAVRLGLAAVRALGESVAERIVAARPFTDIEDLSRRAELDRPVLEALATAGALSSFRDRSGRPFRRREATWVAGAAAAARPGQLPGTVGVAESPRLPGMDPHEEVVADLWATGVSPSGHPVASVRPMLDHRGVVPNAELVDHRDGERVLVAGIVTHRQRPSTAAGITFVNLEDDTGLVNVVCSVGCWARFRSVLRSAPAVLIRGRLERTVDGVVNVVAERVEPLALVWTGSPARDFR
ncbi:MAG: OB-fold nucleic acid binding domain-containing protein, partial [Actinomycetes bacterium]